MKQGNAYRAWLLFAAAGFVLALLSGCATRLQKADRAMKEGRYAQALAFYREEYNEQKRSAELPRWRRKQFDYVFNARNASAALLGMAQVYERTGDEARAAFYYSVLADFCGFHDLPMTWSDQVGSRSRPREQGAP